MSPRRGVRNLGAALSSRAVVAVVAAVVVLVVVDVVLVSLALGRTSPTAGGEAGPIPTYSSTPVPSAVTPTPTASATTAPATDTAPAVRLLSAVSAQEAWRASAGTCGGDEPVLSHTVDGGATWTPVALGTDVGALMAIRASTTGVSVLAGTGTDCTPTVRTSADDGATWKAGAAGAAGAGVDTAGLVLSTGTVAAPCTDPSDVFQGDRTTAVVCEDALAWRSGTGAWVTVPMAGVRSIDAVGSAYTLARVGVTGCSGVQVSTMPAVNVTTASKDTPVGCDAVTGAADAVAIAHTGNSVWLWAGSGVDVSTDGGVTW